MIAFQVLCLILIFRISSANYFYFLFSFSSSGSLIHRDLGDADFNYHSESDDETTIAKADKTMGDVKAEVAELEKEGDMELDTLLDSVSLFAFFSFL